MIVSFYFPQTESADSRAATENLIRQIQQGNPGMKRSTEAQRTVQIGGQQGVLTPLESQSPYRGETEVDMLVTVSRPDGLFYMIFISPRSEWGDVQRVYDEMMRSVRFPS